MAAPADPSVIPQVPYEDGLAALAWLERAFGFRELPGTRLVGAGGALHAEVATPLGGLIMLGSDGGHGVYAPGAGGRPSMILSVFVDDVDAHCAAARAAGARICAEPEDHFFGDRVYECLDPEQHRWRFHQRLRPSVSVQEEAR